MLSTRKGTPESISASTSNELLNAGPASYTYDDDGNVLTKTDSTGTTSYTWDFENRLMSVRLPGGSITSFKYDPFGRRIQKGSSLYVYDGFNLIQESDSAGNLVARYIHGPEIDAPLAAYRGSTSEFYEADALGSITSLTNTSGVINQTYVYDSFGNTFSTTGTFVQPFRYTAREFDTETGLMYYRARYYDSATGRFLSEDPLGFGGGNNFYPYVGNNPTDFSDPDGRTSAGTATGVTQAEADAYIARLEAALARVSWLSRLAPWLRFAPYLIPERVDPSEKQPGDWLLDKLKPKPCEKNDDGDHCMKVRQECQDKCWEDVQRMPVLPQDKPGLLRKCIRKCMADQGCSNF